jgi:hypothetical protein
MKRIPKTGLYFSPGEVMLTVEHSTSFSLDEFTGKIQQIFDEFRKRVASDYPSAVKGLSDQITVKSDDIVTLPISDGRFRSLVIVAISDLRDKYISDNDFDVPASNKQIIGFIEAAFAVLSKGKAEQSDENDVVTLTHISPNWHSTSSPPVLDPTGGPGARPHVLPAPQTAYRFQFDQSSATADIRKLVEQRADGEANVVILDTAPTLELDGLLKEFPKHPLIKTLCQPGRLQIHRYDRDVAPHASGRMARLNGDQYGIGIEGHDYYMRDHGLFIAGIIHSIAPTARLHLVQVLNDYGVGTLETIGNGIGYIHKLFAGNSSPLIINCSLTIQMPLRKINGKRNGKKREFFAHPSDKLSWTRLMDSKTAANPLAEALQIAVEGVFSSLYSPTSKIVAAAGNDRNGAVNPPRARMPASFQGVIGVGALKRNFDRADYSNEADDPLSDGVETFGGDTVAITGGTRADTKKGTLGIYTEDMQGNKNPSGWGRWAGTSFATPVIAGVMALLCSDGRSIDAAWDVIKAAQPEPPDTPQRFLVTQG